MSPFASMRTIWWTGIASSAQLRAHPIHDFALRFGQVGGYGPVFPKLPLRGGAIQGIDGFRLLDRGLHSMRLATLAAEDRQHKIARGPKMRVKAH